MKVLSKKLGLPLGQSTTSENSRDSTTCRDFAQSTHRVVSFHGRSSEGPGSPCCFPAISGRWRWQRCELRIFLVPGKSCRNGWRTSTPVCVKVNKLSFEVNRIRKKTDARIAGHMRQSIKVELSTFKQADLHRVGASVSRAVFLSELSLATRSFAQLLPIGDDCVCQGLRLLPRRHRKRASRRKGG